MIEVNDLHFTYPGKGGETLKGLSLGIDPGEIYGFLGPSGAGKSTAQKVFMGILRGYEGSVKLFGRELSRSDRDIYERIGVSFELPNLYGRLTALENLQLFSGLYRTKGRDPQELLQQVGLFEERNRRIDKYSKGMKMRLNFCRSLLPNPDLLFLDEPTGGLDPANAVMVRQLILKEKERGAAIFLTTHNMDVAAKLCDRVAFLKEGSIVGEGTPDDLSLKEGSGEVFVEVEAAAEAAAERDAEEAEQDPELQSATFPLKNIGSNRDFITFLNSGKVRRISTDRASLEEVFLRITGTDSAGEER
jgi:fluoroquinolone transport system ATP-binding protein